MFRDFKKAVQAQFAVMQKHELFRVQVSKDDLVDTYLKSFPEGTDPVFKERTEHDCNACKSFIRTVGGVVAINNGATMSIWDVNVGGFYQEVANALSKRVKAAPIDNFFLHTERTAGVDKNFAQRIGGGHDTYEHFFVNIPKACVVKGEEVGTQLGHLKTTKEVMYRGLSEISHESVEIVLELISQGSIYRGNEHKFAVEAFSKLQKKFLELTSDEEKDLFCWAHVKDTNVAVSRIRNTSIGTLLVDLSEGTELEPAVAKFEKMMAPENYKRPTALITKGMIENARKAVAEMGVESALGRRFAVLTDVTVNNVLFADRTAKKAMGVSVFDALSAEVADKPKNFDKVEEISIENFMANVLPTAKSIEAMFENRHCGNLVSLIAPEDATAPNIFKWPNGFSWAYAGEVADSIKEQVKSAGGKVDGVLRFSIMWSGDQIDNSDLDAHCKEPTGEIYFGNKRVASGGNLDVDITQPITQRRDKPAVENITYPSTRTMRDGAYKFFVNQFSARNSKGFSAEIEFNGQTYHYDYPREVHGNILVAEVTLKDGVFSIKHMLPSSASTKEVWGLPTQSFQKVNVMMHSPNHWDGNGVGNRHYFFFLDGCINDTNPRGFFNEFLLEKFTPHRKVFEVLGSKTKVEDSPDQLSGLGFSSTKRDNLIVRVKGAMTRVLKITF